MMHYFRPQLSRLSGLWLIALACFHPLFPSVFAQPAFTGHTFTNAAGQTLPYQLLQPDQTSGKARFPLVLFFHGAGERGVDNQKQLVHGTSLFLKPEVRREYPCFVLAPQCPEGQQWVDMPWEADAGDRPAEPSKTMALALQLLDQLLNDYAVDTNRIYVTGLSMGGFATWDCLTRFPQRFAAAIPVCGGGDEKTITPETAQVPVWAFHSDDDTVVKVFRTRHMVEAMRSAGGHPKYTQYTGLGHNSWDKAYSEADLLPWLFEQRLNERRHLGQTPANPASQPK